LAIEMQERNGQRYYFYKLKHNTIYLGTMRGNKTIPSTHKEALTRARRHNKQRRRKLEKQLQPLLKRMNKIDQEAKLLQKFVKAPIISR